MSEIDDEKFEYGGFLYEKKETPLCCALRASIKGFGKEVIIPREVLDETGKKYTVTSLFQNLFENDSAKNMEILHIPAGISALIWDFWKCNNLREIHVDAGSQAFCDIEGVVYTKDKQSLVFFPPVYPAEEYHVLSSTRKIEKLAFKIAKNLKKLYIPDSVQHIGVNAFYRCAALEHVYIEGKLKTVEGMIDRANIPLHAVFHYLGREWTFEALQAEVRKNRESGKVL